jgi:hypothetical protein
VATIHRAIGMKAARLAKRDISAETWLVKAFCVARNTPQQTIAMKEYTIQGMRLTRCSNSSGWWVRGSWRIK